jgi:VCBS repeat protein
MVVTAPASRKGGGADRIRLTACCGSLVDSIKVLTDRGSPGYRSLVLLMSLRRGPLYLAAVAGLLLGWASADASPRHGRRPHPIQTVHVSADGAGTVISVEFRGRKRPRLIHVATPVEAVAIADVDNDGDLDILAASTRDGLVLWRNAGRGRFVLARAPSISSSPRSAGAWLTSRGDRHPVQTDADRLEAEIPRTSFVQGYFDTVPFFVAADRRAPHRPDRPRPSRAPPSVIG